MNRFPGDKTASDPAGILGQKRSDAHS